MRSNNIKMQTTEGNLLQTNLANVLAGMVKKEMEESRTWSTEA